MRGSSVAMQARFQESVATPIAACTRVRKQRLRNKKLERPRLASLEQEQRQRARQVTVRSMSGEEKYFEVPAPGVLGMKQAEFYQLVRKECGLPRRESSTSLGLYFIGRQPGVALAMERWRANDVMESSTDICVTAAWRGSVWQFHLRTPPRLMSPEGSEEIH